MRMTPQDFAVSERYSTPTAPSAPPIDWPLFLAVTPVLLLYWAGLAIALIPMLAVRSLRPAIR